MSISPNYQNKIFFNYKNSLDLFQGYFFLSIVLMLATIHLIALIYK